MNDDQLTLSAVHGLASVALSKAEAADFKVEAHEDLCAERYAHIKTSISDVKDTVATLLKVIGWGGSVLAMILISLTAFFGARALTTNDAQVDALKAQIVQLQQAQRTPEKFTAQP